MLQSMLRDVAFHRSTWMPLAVVACVSAAVLGIVLAAVDSAAAADDPGVRAVAEGMSGPIIGLVVVSTFIATRAVTLSILGALTDTTTAWRVLGLSDRAAYWLLVTQLTVVAALGTLGGAAVTLTLSGTAIDAISRTVLSGADVPTLLRPATLIAPVVAVTATILALGMSLTRSFTHGRDVVGRHRQISLLSARGRNMRIVTAGMLTIALIGTIAGFAYLRDYTEDPSMALAIPSGGALFIGLFVTVIISVLGVWFVPSFIRHWTRVIPPGWSLTFGIARRVTEYRSARTASLVIAVFFPLAFIETLYAVSATTAASSAELAGIAGVNTVSVVLALGPALLIAFVSAAAVSALDNRARVGDSTRLRVLGLRIPSLVGIVVIESLIYVITAMLLTLIPTLIATIFCAATIVSSSTPPAIIFPPSPLLVTAPIALLVLIFAALPSAFVRTGSRSQRTSHNK